MAEGLSDERIREFTDAFNDLDKNRTGYLSTKGLAVLMRSMGHILNESDLANINTDSEMCVGLMDFLQIMAKRESDSALQEKLKKAFAVFDRDGSGFISIQDLRVPMMSVGGASAYTEAEFETFISEYLAEAPENQLNRHPAADDGLMDYMEFIKIMLRKGP
eukprot:TRINITY_DN101007_c0_g1_i1.p1 TRINITY_DN101007_c0_g1~~TRINITY_DN101007_c0_g1_i1.p1  ORF type:complete len:162 (+),score=46.42 TRINITY_DN101007_c0_g1_i1:96-581(+)